MKIGLRRSVVVAAAATLLVATSAGADTLPRKWDGGIYSYDTSAHCGGNTMLGAVDPIGAVFHGSSATYNFLGSYVGNGTHAGHIQHHTGWVYVGNKRQQYYFSFGGCSSNPPDHSMGVSLPRSSTLDYHARFWDQLGAASGHYRLVATPHVDQHDEPNAPCGGDHVPAHMSLPNGGTGSGFDYSRQRLKNAFKRANDHHFVRTEYWGNNKPVFQCNSNKNTRYPAHSDGHVAIIRVGRP